MIQIHNIEELKFQIMKPNDNNNLQDFYSQLRGEQYFLKIFYHKENHYLYEWTYI